MAGVAFLPEEFGRPQERPGDLLPADDVRPLVDEDREVPVGLDPSGIHVADDGLRGRPDGQPFLELLLAADGDPGDLGREALDVLGLLLEEALGDEEREIGVDVARVLDAAVHQPLDVLPDGVAVGPDDHHPLHRRVVGELGLLDDLDVPLGKILALGRDLFDQSFVVAHFIFFASKTLLILSAPPRFVNPRRPGMTARGPYGVAPGPDRASGHGTQAEAVANGSR